MLVPADQIAKRFLILGVTTVAIFPRMPFDQKCSIGGDLSRNFRKLLLFIVAVNLSRLFLSGNESYRHEMGFFSDILGVVEVTALSFLCFLTPYVLETKLSHFIHLTPGADFYCPLYITATLSLLGVLLSRLKNPNYWALKKVAQAVSGPPVIRSLRRFNMITTAQSHGNGFAIGQSALAMEYWHFVLQIICCLGYALDRHHSSGDDDTGYDILLQAARSIAFLGDWTRVLLHALFLNNIDEMNALHVFSSSNDGQEKAAGASTAPRSPRSPTHDPAETVLPLVATRRRP